MDYFNFKMNVKKMKYADRNHEISFLGYKPKGKKFLKDEIDCFKSAVYPEKVVKNLD